MYANVAGQPNRPGVSGRVSGESSKLKGATLSSSCRSCVWPWVVPVHVLLLWKHGGVVEFDSHLLLTYYPCR